MSTIGPTIPQPQAVPTAASPILQVGAVIDALVLALVKDGMARLQTPAGLVDVASEVPLAPGATVRLQVAEQGQLRLLAVMPPQGSEKPAGSSLPVRPDMEAAPVVPATASTAAAARVVSGAPPSLASLRATATDPAVRTEPPELSTPPNRMDPQTAAVALATRTAVSQQRSLAPLLADLAALVGQPGRVLPAPVREAAATVLALRVDAQSVDAGDLRAAFTRSGLFLESNLAAAADLPAGDLKSALLGLRGALQTWRVSLSADGAAKTLPASGASAPPAVERSGPAPSLPVASSDPLTVPAVRGDAVRAPGPNALAAPAAPAASRGVAPDVPAGVIPGAPAASRLDGGDVPSVIQRDPADAPAIDARAVRQLAPSTAALATPQIVKAPMARELPETGAPQVPSSGLPDRPESSVEPRPTSSAASHGLARVLLQALAGERPTPQPLPGSAPNVEPGDSAPPPPYRNGPLAAQPAAPASIPSDAASEEMATRLLSATDGALARQTLMQIASLPDSAASAPGSADRGQPLWTFELPLRTPQGTAILPFEIGRDGRQDAAERGAEWQARFSTDFSALGPVHAQVTLTGERATVTLWAERAVTAGALKIGMPVLEAALREAALEPGNLRILLGAPRSEPAGPGKFLDQAT